MRERIQFDRLEQARWKARDCGGRIAFQPVKDKVFWYSPEYTMTEIFTDTDSFGDWHIGGYSEFVL